ncbi:MAG TPA: D-TA family PLP-dependent enzyme [Dehalococcoidia bacterium]|nr:D-TA family PLP-dependent enzyme [Dehalococcoidia bacterium]
MHIYDLDTPAVIIDMDVLEKNIEEMAAHCRDLGITLRGHTKSHKNPEIAKMQVAAGSVGIVCQKLGDAENMVRNGLDDILMTYNIVGTQKTRRLTALARQCKMTVTVDSIEVAAGISEQASLDDVTVGVLVEIDTGGNRTGVLSPAAAEELAKQIQDLPGLQLRGLMTYPSRSESKPIVQDVVERFKKAGLSLEIFSGGGTGEEIDSKELGFTEHRSGSYVYEGLSRIQGSQGNDGLSTERCPLRVVTTVVSVPTGDRLIIDGGMKTFRLFPSMPYGLIIEDDIIKFAGMSVEHGHIDTSASDRKFKVGDKLTVIPTYQEGVTNLHDEIVWVRNDQVERVWQNEGRGKVK